MPATANRRKLFVTNSYAAERQVSRIEFRPTMLALALLPISPVRGSSRVVAPQKSKPFSPQESCLVARNTTIYVGWFSSAEGPYIPGIGTSFMRK